MELKEPKIEPTVLHEKSSESGLKRTESDFSNLSFKRWHKRMQTEHEILKTTPFKLWKWCDKSFRPCRWFDSIDLNKKLSKCCLTFKTFKNIVTIILVAVFLYAFMFSLLGREVLPGGSVFFLLILFITAYLVGYILTLAGIPGMMGHLVTGITLGNIPHSWLPNRDEELIEEVAVVSEKILLVIALIRGGLLLDLTRMKNRLTFIFCTATFPFLFEFIMVWIASHFLLSLEWNWSALQGSTISIVSLATVTSIMEKNKKHGYGEDIHLSTVLIAAAVINVLLGVILYCICLTYITTEISADNSHSVFGKVMLAILKQSLIGIAVGVVSGFLVSFFPDKRNSEAAGLRIIILGIASFGVTSLLNSLDMNVAAALACLLLCFICTNIWEEIGWHQDSNPVLYFYTMAYYNAQPLVLSLLGYTMDLKGSSGKDIGLSFAVFMIGLIVRESVCFIVLQGKLYHTTLKEKIFICIAWLTKGTFQVLLAFSVLPFIQRIETNPQIITLQMKSDNESIKRTTILATLLLTPLSCYCLTLLTPKLLTTAEDFPPEDTRSSTRKRLSISRYQDTFTPIRKISIKYYQEIGVLDNDWDEKSNEMENEIENNQGTEKENIKNNETENKEESKETTSKEPNTKSKKGPKGLNKSLDKK